MVGRSGRGVESGTLLGRGISRRSFLKIGGAGLAGASLLSIPGCGVFESSGGGTGGGAVTVNLGDTIRDLDSTTTTDGVSSNVLVNVIEGLYRLDENAQPVPAQAEGVEISDDKLTYTFTLRDGLQWSDGSPVTAMDFEYAWFKALDPKTAGQYAYIIAQFVQGATEYNAGDGKREDVAIRATGDKTLEVKLVAPSPFWLGLTAFFTYYPQKQSFVEEQGDGYAQSTDALLYNGPYMLTEFDPTKGITLVKNQKYWDAGSVGIPKVVVKIVKELDTAVNLHEAGELDLTEIDSEYVREFRDSPDFDQRTTFICVYLSFNNELPIFQNVNIRKAFQLGYDRKALTSKLLNDGSVPASGYVPDGIDGPEDQTFREAQGPVQKPFDAAEAKRLFQKGIEEVSENPAIELLSFDDSTARDIATFLQSQFEDNLGAKIDVKIQPFDRKLELEANGDFQLSYQGWGADYNDPMTFLDLWLSDASFNTGKYANKEYDRLITQAQQEAGAAKRLKMLREAEKLLVEEDAGVGPMYFEGEVYLIEPFIKNYVNHPYGGGIDISKWRVER
ncbi:MAG: peptide ABC transporter substrate-binding protein [Rubrobacter sp.]|nr:peptide ABC transporter substrate-binding protein [Rubrobacter sp.]